MMIAIGLGLLNINPILHALKWAYFVAIVALYLCCSNSGIEPIDAGIAVYHWKDKTLRFKKMILFYKLCISLC